MDIKNRRFIAVCIAIALLGSALALTSTFVGMRSIAPTYAAPATDNSDLSVVGPPTLPASTVNSIFARLGSPMAGTGALVEKTSRQENIDDSFALAVWWTETNDGAAGVGLADRNPGSVRGSIGYPSAYDGYTIYPSYSAAIVYWFHMIKNVYVGQRGLSTVYTISHPYVGTSSSPLWAGKVIALMLSYRGEVPPQPKPTVAPTPTISPEMLAHRKFLVDPNASSDTTDTDTTIQSSTIGVRATTPAQIQSSPSMFSPMETTAIVIVALLLALVIALWAMLLTGSSARLPEEKQAIDSSAELANDPFRQPPEFQPLFFRLPSRSLDEPHTEALSSAQPVALPSTSPLSPDTQMSLSTSKLRRTLLLPALPNSTNPDTMEEVAMPAGERTTGLLSRYGKKSDLA